MLAVASLSRSPTPLSDPLSQRPSQLRVSTRPNRSFRSRRIGKTMATRADGCSVVSTDKGVKPLGAYSQGIKTGNLVFVSGQLGLIPGTTNFVSDDAAEQTTQALKNVGAILEAAGSSHARVVKATVMMSSIDDFAAIDAAYGKFFQVNPPARAAFAAKALPLNGKVEIDAIATCD